MIRLRYVFALMLQMPLLAMQAPKHNQIKNYLQLLPQELRIQVGVALVYQQYPELGLVQKAFKFIIGGAQTAKEQALEAVRTYMEAHDKLIEPCYGTLLQSPEAAGAVTLALSDRFGLHINDALEQFTTPATTTWLIKNGFYLCPFLCLDDRALAYKQFQLAVTNDKNAYLLKHIATMHDKDGTTALFDAVQHNRADLVEVLLKQGASIHQLPATHVMGYSLLGLAASEGHVDIVKLLLEYNAPPDVCREQYSVLTMLTCSLQPSANHVKIVELLLAQGANPNNRTSGKTPLEWAQHMQQLSIRGANSKAAAQARKAIIKLLENTVQQQP